MNRGKSGGLFQPQTLDIDESIFDRNLKIVTGAADGQEDATASPFFTGAAPSQPKRATLLPADPGCPSLEVTPVAGFCVKTKNLAGEKVFLNVCRIGEIPPAKPISEEQLQKLIAEEDYASDYRCVIFRSVSRWGCLSVFYNVIVHCLGFPCPWGRLDPRRTNPVGLVSALTSR